MYCIVQCFEIALCRQIKKEKVVTKKERPASNKKNDGNSDCQPPFRIVRKTGAEADKLFTTNILQIKSNQ